MELYGTAEQDQRKRDQHRNCISGKKQPGVSTKMPAHISPAYHKKYRRINCYTYLMECILKHVHSKSAGIFHSMFIQINNRCNTRSASKRRNTIKGTEKHVFYSPLIAKSGNILSGEDRGNQCLDQTINHGHSA